jgi:multiple sugar transport system substrate-binding protein
MGQEMVMRSRAIVLAAALMVAPLGAQTADLVVWWEKGFYPQEDEAVAEIVAAFEEETGKQVELAFYPQRELGPEIQTALGWANCPTSPSAHSLATTSRSGPSTIGSWTFTDAVGFFSNLFDPDALAWWVLLNAKTGQKSLYGLPMGQYRQYIHVWKSLLERAGFTLDDIPKEWETFWAFWCDQVQPAVRQATGRADIWGVGLSMAADSVDTSNQFDRFMAAYEAEYVTRDGRLVIENPEVQRQLIKAIDGYTTIYRKGCTPPQSVAWDSSGNNKAFHAQAVVMTPNNTLSVVNALKHERPDDYYENTATIEWPLGPNGKAFPDGGGFFAAAVFKDGGHVAAAKEFVRFLVGEGWLAHYLDFSGERMLPAIPKLLEQPFWLDPSDPHRMAAVMQASARPLQYDYATVTGDWRYDLAMREEPWAKAVHRIVTEGISPERAVDETRSNTP